MHERSPTSQTPAPGHRNGDHRDTVSHIFQHPVGHNIDRQAVVSLLEGVAQVEETHHGKVLVTLGSETETFEPPRHKDIDVQQMVDLRRMLRKAGYGASADDVESVTSARASRLQVPETSQ